MGYNEQMQQCSEYISAHVHEQITALQLSNLCGYSLYHFCRVFKVYFGVSVGEYIRSLKLQLAAEEIKQGASVLETALKYGYDTHAGFTKAFEKAFGVSPREYQKRKGAIIMNYKIVQEEAIKVFGYVIETEETVQGGYWEKVDFSNLPAYPENCVDLGEVAIWIHPSVVSGELKYFFGYKTTDTTPAPGFESLTIPAARYAVFEFENGDSATALAKQMNIAWKEIFSSWFDTVEYQFDEEKMCFEFYKENKSYIYIPIK